MADEAESLNSLELATELTVAWLSNPNTRASADQVPGFLRTMHEAVSGLSSASEPEQSQQQPQHEPAVSVRKSLASNDHILSMIDGKPYKSLRRHLTGHGLTPEQYRERYGLKKDYPMVSRTYSEQRREMAKKIGLGRKPGSGAAASKAAPARRRKNAIETPAS